MSLYFYERGPRFEKGWEPMAYTVFTRLLAALDCKPHEIDLKI